MARFLKTPLRVVLLLGLSVLSLDQAGASDAAANIVVRLSTKGNDIAFNQEAIQVPFGKKVKLQFVNDAAKDSEILHNVAILKPGTTDAVIKDLQANGYDLEKIRRHPSVIAMTKSLQPGGDESLEFTPPEPGFYPYVCLMPGHADVLGMKGLLNVQK